MLDHNAVIKHFDYKQLGADAPPLLSAEPPRRRVARITIEADACGITNIGQRLWRQKPTRRIGTLVPTNSGRPGGACARQAGSNEARTHRAGVEDDDPLDVDALHADHESAEEDLVSNWLCTAAHNAEEAVMGSGFVSTVFASSIHGEWGLLDPTGCNPIMEYLTAQRVNYTEEEIDASSYADAWVVEGVRLSSKSRHSLPTRKLPSRFDTSQQYPTTLVFVAGPNADSASASDPTPGSYARRTYSSACAENYDRFCGGVKAALRTGLHAMAMRGCNVAVLGQLPGGKRAGQWGERLSGGDYRKMVESVLAETHPQSQPFPLSRWFELVVVCESAPEEAGSQAA